MIIKDEWTQVSWFCSNCGRKVIGNKNSKDTFVGECNRCHAKMVRTVKGRRCNTIKLYAPERSQGLYV